jgi:chromosomal replication initiation ATPase DnaA
LTIPARISAIVQAVAAEHRVPVAFILAPVRGTKRQWLARRAAMQAVRASSPMPSYPKIGQWFGRDHSTVMQACGQPEPRPACQPFDLALRGA